MSFKIIENSKPTIGVVGAGPAGAMAAYLFASKGYQVTILERNLNVERKVCGEYLCPEGVNLLKNLGLYDELCKGFNQVEGMFLVSPTGVEVPSYFPKQIGSENGSGVSLNRKIFDKKLLQKAIDNGAQLKSGITIKGVHKSTDGQWKIMDTDENIHEFDFLIAADGRQSKIGNFLGHIKAKDTQRAALHCYLPRKLDRGQRLGEMHILNNESYCGLDPITDDEVNFSIVCNSSLLKSHSPLEIINDSISHSSRLSSMFDLLGSEMKKDIKIVTSLKNVNSFISGDNLAYVGDAAGFIDPLTGEGIYNAILSSHLLCESIFTNDDLSSALAHYKIRKKKLSFQKNLINNFFQFLIRKPMLVNFTAWYLKRSPAKANNFIGIIGNVHSPAVGIIKILAA